MKEKQERITVSIPQLLKRLESSNLASDLDGELLAKISRRCIEDLKTDEQSRKEWIEKNKQSLDLAMQVSDETDIDNPSADVKYPALTVAALQFHARAYPAIVRGNQVVRGQVTGEDPQGIKAQQARRIERHMSYQLLEEMPEWEEDMDKMLIALPILGCMFKKSYFSKYDARNCSELIWPKDLVINYKAKSMLAAPRITHLIGKYPQEIIEKQMQGHYLNVDLGFGEDRTTEELQEVFEQHCLIDLDEDGYKEPYIVTIHKVSEKVLRIVANYDKDTLFIKDGDNIVSLADLDRQHNDASKQVMAQYQQQAVAMQQQGAMPPPPPSIPELDYKKMTLAKLEPVRYFTKFSFIPAPDGGIYDIGFGWLLYHIIETINTTINQIIDAGSLANLQGGFKAKSLITDKKGEKTWKRGELKDVDNLTGGSIRDSIYLFDFKGPSGVLFNLLSLMIDAATDITGVKDIMTGDVQQEETATTTLARVEQGMKVFTAIYKRIYRSLKDEFKKLKRLNKLYLPVSSYYRVLDSGVIDKIGLADYEADDTDVQPVADPTIVSMQMRVAKAQMIKQMGTGNPLYNQREVERRALESIEAENIDTLLYPEGQGPEQPPDPKMLEVQGKLEKMAAEIEKMAMERLKMAAEIETMRTTGIKNIAEAEAKEVGSQFEQYRFQLDAIAQGMKGMQDEFKRSAQPGGTSPVAQQPANGAGTEPLSGAQGVDEQQPLILPGEYGENGPNYSPQNG